MALSDIVPTQKLISVLFISLICVGIIIVNSSSRPVGYLNSLPSVEKSSHFNDKINQKSHNRISDTYVRYHESLNVPELNTLDIVEFNSTLDPTKNQKIQQDKLSALKRLPDYESVFYRLDVEAEVKQSVHGSPLQPFANFRNPCWLAKLESADPYPNPDYRMTPRIDAREKLSEVFEKKLRSGFHWHTRCLPGAYILGFAKSGSTDLYVSVTQHPKVANVGQEVSYWNWLRLWKPAFESWHCFHSQPRPNFTDYVGRFGEAAEMLQADVIVKNGQEFHPKIIIDKTPHYIYDYDGWEKIPANQGLDEPRVILAHSMYQLQPKAKLIVIMRNPVKRIFSHFVMFHNKFGSPDDDVPRLFHERTLEVLSLWQQCTQHHSVRPCAYNTSLNPYEHKFLSPGGYALRGSLYHIFLEDWFKVYPRQQFFIIYGDDYYKNKTTVLEKLFSFLDLDSLVPEVYKALGETRTKSRPSPSILNATRDILQNFFQPFNRKLASLLNDQRYLWE